MTLLLVLGITALFMLAVGSYRAAVRVRRYRSETEQRRARAFASMADVARKAEESKEKN